MNEIFYVENDAGISNAVKEYLQQNGYKVEILETIEKASRMLMCKKPNLILIDRNLPDGDGYQLCRLIRKTDEILPIIFLTVMDDSREIVSGFQAGADDYISKPFDLNVLYARISAVLKRSANFSENQIRCDAITIDKIKMRVYYDKEEITLSQIEYQLLKILMENKGCILTRSRLLELFWDIHGNFVNDNTLTVTIRRLREKLHNPTCIKTVRSFGYRMEECT